MWLEFRRVLFRSVFHLVEIELKALGLFLRQQRIEIAESLDEAAVARRTRVGDDDVIDRPLLGAGAGHANDERHFSSSFLAVVTVSRTRCSAKRCIADPGPFQIQSLQRSRICSAPLRAALRPGRARSS